MKRFALETTQEGARKSSKVREQDGKITAVKVTEKNEKQMEAAAPKTENTRESEKYRVICQPF